MYLRNLVMFEMRRVFTVQFNVQIQFGGSCCSVGNYRRLDFLDIFRLILAKVNTKNVLRRCFFSRNTSIFHWKRIFWECEEQRIRCVNPCQRKMSIMFIVQFICRGRIEHATIHDTILFLVSSRHSVFYLYKLDLFSVFTFHMFASASGDV